MTLKLTPEEKREQINARRRERYALDPEYRAKKDAAASAWRASKKTGYGRGRPRIGEVRPVSVLAEMHNRYRAGNEQWKEYNRKMQAAWIAKNPERRKAIVTAYCARRKERMAAE